MTLWNVRKVFSHLRFCVFCYFIALIVTWNATLSAYLCCFCTASSCSVQWLVETLTSVFPFPPFFLEVNHVALFQCCMLSLNFACVSSQKASYISVTFQTVYDGVLSRMLFINDYAWKKCSLQHYHWSPPLVSKLTWEHCVMDVKVMPAL